jgi:hypothetical protein
MVVFASPRDEEGDLAKRFGRIVLSDVLYGFHASDFRLRPSLCRGNLCRQGCDCSFSPDSGMHARTKEVRQSGGVCRGVRGWCAFLPFSNTKITMEIPDVFLYIDSLRKCYIAHCYLPSHQDLRLELLWHCICEVEYAARTCSPTVLSTRVWC